MLGRADLRAALPTLKMPTAVVVGEEDYAAPVAMARGAAQRHRRLDLHRAAEGAPSHAARSARRHRGRARSAAGACREMKFTGELSVKAPRAAVYEKVRDARFFASCVDGVSDLAEIGPGSVFGGVRDQGRLHEIRVQGDGRGDPRRSAERDRGDGRRHAARHRRAHDRDLGHHADRGRRRDQDRLCGRCRVDRQARQPRPAGAAIEGEGDGEAVRRAARAPRSSREAAT